MTHVAQGVQTSEHHDATEHDLREHSDNEPEREAYQATLTRSHEEGCEHRGNHAGGHHAGKQPVQLFDCCVRCRDIDETFLIARRPVDATKARTCEPHQRTRHDDDVERGKCHPDDDSVSAQRQRALRATALIKTRGGNRVGVHGLRHGVRLGKRRTIVSS